MNKPKLQKSSSNKKTAEELKRKTNVILIIVAAVLVLAIAGLFAYSGYQRRLAAHRGDFLLSSKATDGTGNVISLYNQKTLEDYRHRILVLLNNRDVLSYEIQAGNLGMLLPQVKWNEDGEVVIVGIEADAEYKVILKIDGKKIIADWSETTYNDLLVTRQPEDYNVQVLSEKVSIAEKAE